jgi:putative OPT family oligopeptide transporter
MLGGIMGILFMIPLRKYLVEKEHNNLRYPEGTACAEILIAGDEGGGKAKTVFAAIGIGALYKFLMSGTKLWSESPTYNLDWYKGGYVGIDATPALLGVGYIIGPRIAALMLAGAVLGYLGIGPLIAYLGAHFPQIIPPANIPISQMTPADLRNFYIKYLGVGAVALGGFISLIKSLPMIINSFSEGAQQIFSKKGRETSKTIPRTKRDLPISLVIFGSLAIVFLLWLFSGREIHIVGVFLAVIFGFFFVTVAARIVGIVGSSSSPVSGMTIATLLVTCLILLSFGLGGYRGMVAAMIVGTVVCIAVCMSGDISQDLKTGFLLGSSPYKQQWTEFVGLLFPAFFMGITIALLNKSYGFVGPGALLAPQANVMAALVQGVMNQNLPWIPIIVGAMLALSIELLGIGSLPFAIGLYLPLNLSTPIMAGAIIYTIVEKISPKDIVDKRTEKGILFGSGLVAGDALVGVIIAGLIAIPSIRIIYEKYEEGFLFGTASGWVSLIAFLILCGVFYLFTKVKPLRDKHGASKI